MNPDRAFRNLGALQKTASTSRVLNLIAVAAQHGETPEYAARPFFRTRTLNQSVLLKHRLRMHERADFDDHRPTATKVIIPFERTDLKLGGRSVFVGQRGWTEVLRQVVGDGPDLERDLQLLKVVDELPSLDPFLLREHLKRREYSIAQCYFAISESDVARMQAYVAREIQKLIELAYANAPGGEGYAAKLVQTLLSSETDERLEPLRLTLKLEGDSYREGVFCWKGFLYYKWVLAALWPELKAVMDEVPTLRTTGPRDGVLLAYLSGARQRVQEAIEVQRREVLMTLQVYDAAFRELTVNGNPIAFRDFLLKAPEMFLSLGEKIGVASHIASFWRYRFPAGRPPVADLSEAVDILQEFEAGLGCEVSA
ncbi:MAG: hypothetical protein IT546_05155 [Caulobacteraceae bacterium]|nr:hypothetical protein [Caulobacteraceae bacterium]